MKEIVGSSVLILGYGAEGQSVHRWLKKFHPKVRVEIYDEASLRAKGRQTSRSVAIPKIAASGRTVWCIPPRNDVRSFDTIIKSPGFPTGSPIVRQAKDAGKHVTSLTNIFFSACPGKIIAVTGTKGKSTTASLIHAIFSRAYPDVRLVGNIGNPALDYLERADKNTLFVMEISSYQLEDIRYSPHIAVILDIVPEHLDRYQNFKNYIAAKSQIVRFQSPEDYVIFNPDHDIPAKIASKSPGRKITFAPRTNLHGAEKEALIPPENYSAAIAVAGIFGVPTEKIRQAIARFKPLPHRLEHIGNFDGIDFYDDSIATIPQATIYALDALGEKVQTLIAGGFDRGLDYTELGKFLVNRKGLKNLILFPDTGAKIWQTVLTANGKQPLHLMKFPVSSMKQAVRIAFAKTDRGKICLLSPAAASYNLFKNFEARGREFKKQILLCQ